MLVPMSFIKLDLVRMGLLMRSHRIEDMGAFELRDQLMWCLRALRPNEIADSAVQGSYAYMGGGIWHFSRDVNPDQVRVRFVLDGTPYDIEAWTTVQARPDYEREQAQRDLADQLRATMERLEREMVERLFKR